MVQNATCHNSFSIGDCMQRFKTAEQPVELLGLSFGSNAAVGGLTGSAPQ